MKYAVLILGLAVSALGQTPTITSINPSGTSSGAKLFITIVGTNFTSPITVNITGSGNTSSAATLVSSTVVTSVLTLNAAAGTYALSVTTSGGTSSTVPLSLTAAGRPTAILPTGITCSGGATNFSCSGTVMDTTYSLPVGGTTYTPANSSALQSAFNSAVPGDVINLTPGTVYTGNFTIPAKSNPSNKWIYVTSTGFNALHPPGTRVLPAAATDMAKVTNGNAVAVLTFVGGTPNANYWRFTGIELYCTSSYAPPGYRAGVFVCQPFIGVGNWPFTTPSPDHIVFDRIYIHGSDTQDIQTAIQANFNYYGLIDSYCSQIHMTGTDTQCTGAFFSSGPFKIDNNYLEGAGENIEFGGSGKNADAVPSDVEIQNNYFYKPLSWVPLSTTAPCTYTVKNLLEFKSGNRVLINHNVLENNWASSSCGQAGAAIPLTVRSNQSGDLAVVDNFTITNNYIKNVVAGINTLGADDGCTPAIPCSNAGEMNYWNVMNNLITLYDPTLPGGSSINYMIAWQPGQNKIADPTGATGGQPKNVNFQHNTVVPNPSQACWGGVYFGVGPYGSTGPPAAGLTANLWETDNVMCRQPYGTWGNTLATLSTYAGTTSNPTGFAGLPNTSPNDINARWTGNVMLQNVDTVKTWPTGNVVPSTITFVNPSTENYTLSSPNWTNTTDGVLAGVNMAYINGSFPTVTTSSCPPGNVGVPYVGCTLTATGGAPPYTWSISSGTLCTNLNLVSGSITGTPTSAQTCSFSVIAQDSAGINSSPKPLSITVTGVTPPGLAITNTTFVNGSVGVPYDQIVSITGGVPPYVSLVVNSGNLPTGVTIQNLSGTWHLKGTPATAGGNTFTLKVTDSATPTPNTAIGGPFTITIINVGTTTVSGAILYALL